MTLSTIRCWAIGALFILGKGWADPWGKDADLKLGVSSIDNKVPLPPSLWVKWGIEAIRFHQEVISPADGPRSHYIPSSSQYTKDAMASHGFLWGFLLGCDRLMRENGEEWVYRKTRDGAGHPMKWDPIPNVPIRKLRQGQRP